MIKDIEMRAKVMNDIMVNLKKLENTTNIICEFVDVVPAEVIEEVAGAHIRLSRAVAKLRAYQELHFNTPVS